MKKSNIAHIIRLCISSVMGVLVTWFFMGNKLFGSIEMIVWGALYGLFIGGLLSLGINYISLKVAKKYPWFINPTQTLRNTLFAVSIFIVIWIFAVNYVFFIMWMQIPEKFAWTVLWRNTLIGITISALITCIYYIKHFFFFWKETLFREQKYKAESIQFKYDMLRNQVTPHFLFNSLNVLSALVETDTQAASGYIKKLSDFYRYTLEHRTRDLVPLKEELDLIRSFVFMQKFRYGDSFSANINIDEPKGYVLPLTLQMLVENAIKHNIATPEKPLIVTISQSKNLLVVDNKLQKKNSIIESENVGLANIKERYSYFSDIPIEVSDCDERFVVKIPILSVEK